MKDFLSHLFSDSDSVSMMRLLAFICVFAAIGLAFLGKPGYEYFLFAAFGGKTIQKGLELKLNDKNNGENK